MIPHCMSILMAKYQCHQVQYKLELISLDSKLVLKILTELAQEYRYFRTPISHIRIKVWALCFLKHFYLHINR